MQLVNSLLLGLGLASSAIEATSIYAVHFKFEGGPASYTLDVPTDGKAHATGNVLSISIIDAPAVYDAFKLCTFKTQNPATLVAEGHKIIVGPPTPIISVTCKAP
ncbi:hypothetical protein GGR57DRAFT_515953 [Xylariaceae sp. FL1272]|nr:hypothetical protein GGR57DRAFT_515953 [Xylariaceae sp. FL1272]